MVVFIDALRWADCTEPDGAWAVAVMLEGAMDVDLCASSAPYGVPTPGGGYSVDSGVMTSVGMSGTCIRVSDHLTFLSY